MIPQSKILSFRSSRAFYNHMKGGKGQTCLLIFELPSVNSLNILSIAIMKSSALLECQLTTAEPFQRYSTTH
jgi:hypothetical protein